MQNAVPISPRLYFVNQSYVCLLCVLVAFHMGQVGCNLDNIQYFVAFLTTLQDLSQPLAEEVHASIARRTSDGNISCPCIKHPNLCLVCGALEH